MKTTKNKPARRKGGGAAVKRSPRATKGPKAVDLPATRTKVAASESNAWAGASLLARTIADEFERAAKRLIDRNAPAGEKNALAREVARMHRLMLSHDENVIVRTDFVRTVTESIAEFDAAKAELAKVEADLATASTDLLAARAALLRYAREDTYGERAKIAFERAWPDHARLLSREDYELAVRAVRGDAPPKWETLATIITNRMRLPTAAETLKKYVERAK